VDYGEIPTIPSTLSKLESALGNLDLKALSKKLVSVLTSADRILQNPNIDASINEFKGTLVDARKLVNNVDEEVKPLSGKAQTTLGDVGKLARHVDAKVDPIAESVEKALKSVDTAFKSIDELVGKRSPTRAEVDKTLKEIQKAARSMRILADYLEQHPEALLKGKGSGKY
jgi:paraquat-inducible protein B